MIKIYLFITEDTLIFFFIQKFVPENISLI